MHNLNTENIASLSFSETQKKGLLCSLLLAKIILLRNCWQKPYCTTLLALVGLWTLQEEISLQAKVENSAIPLLISKSSHKYVHKVLINSWKSIIRQMCIQSLLLWFRFTPFLAIVSNWHNTQWWSKEFSKNMLFFWGGGVIKFFLLY